jgi:hypothetical protein
VRRRGSGCSTRWPTCDPLEGGLTLHHHEVSRPTQAGYTWTITLHLLKLVPPGTSPRVLCGEVTAQCSSTMTTRGGGTRRRGSGCSTRWPTCDPLEGGLTLHYGEASRFLQAGYTCVIMLMLLQSPSFSSSSSLDVSEWVTAGCLVVTTTKGGSRGGGDRGAQRGGPPVTHSREGRGFIKEASRLL